MYAAKTLHPDCTALVVVDLQERLMPAIRGGEAVLGRTRLLLQLAKTLGLPVVATTQYAKGLGPLVPEIAALVPDAAPLDKTSFGCFGDPGFRARLESLPDVHLHSLPFGERGARTRNRCEQLLVVGVETHICVMQTVLGALTEGHTVHVASDAVGARHEDDHRVGLDRMARAGAVVSSTEMAVYELLGRSDSAAFKAMLPLLKG
jgi:nicotinamidase-related amidase